MGEVKKEDFALFADDTYIPEPKEDYTLSDEEKEIVEEILKGDMS